jgi:large-conductance mechanosensitive channel
MIEDIIKFIEEKNILPTIIGISIGIYVSVIVNSLSDNIIKPILNELIDENKKNSLNKLHINLPSNKNKLLFGQLILDIIGVLIVFIIIYFMSYMFNYTNLIKK